MQQLIELLDQLDQETYTQSLPVFDGSTLGQHFRHILEFYQCLLQGLECHHIDYAARIRHQTLEQVPGAALAVFQEVMAALTLLEVHDQLEVRGDFSPSTSADRPLIGSTVGRELMYAHDHAVHHLAMIKVGLRTSFADIPLDPQLGVASSTIKHQHATAK